jgi:hypothetical protein
MDDNYYLAYLTEPDLGDIAAKTREGVLTEIAEMKLAYFKYPDRNLASSPRTPNETFTKYSQRHQKLRALKKLLNKNSSTF